MIRRVGLLIVVATMALSAFAPAMASSVASFGRAGGGTTITATHISPLRICGVDEDTVFCGV